MAVTGLSLSSQRVVPGDLYAALPGARAHGAAYADDAVAAGAVAVLTDPDGAARVTEAPALVVRAAARRARRPGGPGLRQPRRRA